METTGTGRTGTDYHALTADADSGPGGAERLDVTGNTYPYADRLRRAGLEWDSLRRVWTTTDAVAIERLRADVASGGGLYYFGRRAGERDLRGTIERVQP